MKNKITKIGFNIISVYNSTITLHKSFQKRHAVVHLQLESDHTACFTALHTCKQIVVFCMMVAILFSVYNIEYSN